MFGRTYLCEQLFVQCSAEPTCVNTGLDEDKQNHEPITLPHMHLPSAKTETCAPTATTSVNNREQQYANHTAHQPRVKSIVFCILGLSAHIKQLRIYM